MREEINEIDYLSPPCSIMLVLRSMEKWNRSPAMSSVHGTKRNYDFAYRAGIFKKSMGARHRVGIGLLYRPARLHRLAEFIPWNRFRGPIHVQKYQLSFNPTFL
jgi:hypothetical protein